MTPSNPAMRKLAFLALRATLLPFLLREVVQRKKVTILVYHAPTPEIFDVHLSVLRRVYNIISLSAYVAARKAQDLSSLPQKALIITLDDGHHSNYFLKGVLERHNVPVTIFLCSGVIGTRRNFWFLHEQAATIVQDLKTLPDSERLKLLYRAGFDEKREGYDRAALSLRELRELSSHVDFQSHTVFHPILPRCAPEKAEAEIRNSKSDLEAILGREVTALAYPNGDYSERELRLAEKAGYRCALSLDRGLNTERTPLFRLGRICIPDNADHHELIVKASGLWGEISAALARRRAWSWGGTRSAD